MIVGDTNPSTLATNLYSLYHPLPQMKVETRIQTGAFPRAFKAGKFTGLLEFSDKSSTISLALYNPKRVSGRMTIGFLHNFNNNFCAGVELLTAWSDRSQVHMHVALAGRFVDSIVMLHVQTH